MSAGKPLIIEVVESGTTRKTGNFEVRKNWILCCGELICFRLCIKGNII